MKYSNEETALSTSAEKEQTSSAVVTITKKDDDDIQTPSAFSTKLERQPFVDWLRAASALYVVHGHVHQIITYEQDRFIKEQSATKNVLYYSLAILYNSVIPLLFFISGISIVHSMHKEQNFVAFCKRRFKRLIIPAIATMLLFNLPQILIAPENWGDPLFTSKTALREEISDKSAKSINEQLAKERTLLQRALQMIMFGGGFGIVAQTWFLFVLFVLNCLQFPFYLLLFRTANAESSTSTTSEENTSLSNKRIWICFGCGQLLYSCVFFFTGQLGTIPVILLIGRMAQYLWMYYGSKTNNLRTVMLQLIALPILSIFLFSATPLYYLSPDGASLFKAFGITKELLMIFMFEQFFTMGYFFELQRVTKQITWSNLSNNNARETIQILIILVILNLPVLYLFSSWDANTYGPYPFRGDTYLRAVTNGGTWIVVCALYLVGVLFMNSSIPFISTSFIQHLCSYAFISHLSHILVSTCIVKFILIPFELAELAVYAHWITVYATYVACIPVYLLIYWIPPLKSTFGV